MSATPNIPNFASDLAVCSNNGQQSLTSTSDASLEKLTRTPAHNNVSLEKNSPFKSRKTGDAQLYDEKTAQILFKMMSKAGYRDRKHQKKSLKELFVEGTKLAAEEHGIKRTAKGGQKSFTRTTQEYSASIMKLAKSGRDGDGKNLFQKSEFFERMHEIGI